MITALIFWIIVGLIAGAAAKLVMPGDDPGGAIVTIIIGIVGAVIGGFLLSLIGIGGGGRGERVISSVITWVFWGGEILSNFLVGGAQNPPNGAGFFGRGAKP